MPAGHSHPSLLIVLLSILLLPPFLLAGDRLLSVPVLVHNVSGPGQLLNVASAVVSRMYTLGFLHRYCKGQNASWATRAVAEMRYDVDAAGYRVHAVD